LANQVGRFGIISAIFIFFVLFIRLLVEELQKGGFDFKKNLEKIVHYLIIAVTVVVVSIPEGLPLAVTLTLAYSMKAMH
jgi:magnesium-transporting ATPase (P-type)